ncbi:hypothetical protein [Aurantimonas sp. Leaf443]|uniref:hypothetical protein n=1 Tax=Aurantimonas sp. Leaf443 TaxID=1736378 RepID=UPI0006FC6866|nr:hypothetical protein [Aurantimonas sp. Leaf443]KQT88416.1 hypothetical protein ASG48_03075 [Aurantimonas sp. Leaf443]
MRTLATLLSATAVALAALAGAASAADMGTGYRSAPVYPGAAGVPSSTLPYCDDARVLAQVEDQFEYGAPRVLQVPLQIFEFSGMIEKAYSPKMEDSPIERRYCEARALVSDQKVRPIYYVIEYPMGFAAAGGHVGLLSRWGWRAEGCVLGLDEWHVYGAECQSLRRYPPTTLVTK